MNSGKKLECNVSANVYYVLTCPCMNTRENLVAKNGTGGEVFDEFFELGNGCICCSVRDDLVNTLERLLERRWCS